MQSYHKIRNLFFSVSITALMVTSANATPFINEIHYDNRGSDTGEFIEIAAESGFDLTGWMLTLYNGRNGNSYRNQSLSGLSFGNEFNGYQFATIDIAGIQNGAPDGIALINDSGAVQQFISYEGTFTANNGDAAGLDSADIGQRETSSTAIGDSLQLGDGGWQGPQAATKGTVNTGQTQFANGLDIGGQNGGGGDPPVSSPASSLVVPRRDIIFRTRTAMATAILLTVFLSLPVRTPRASISAMRSKLPEPYPNSGLVPIFPPPRSARQP